MNTEGYIVGLGEVLWDMLPTGKVLGGAPANFAYHIAQHRLPAMVVSAVGNDELGIELRKVLEGKGLTCCLVPQPSLLTGIVGVKLDALGIPEYEITENVAWDNISFTSEMLSIAQNTIAVCFGSLAQRSAVSRKTIMRFLDSMPLDALKIFDINLRQHYYDKGVVHTSLGKCNVLKINENELAELCRMFDVVASTEVEQCEWFMENYDLNILIMTCGEKGSHVLSAGVRSYKETPVVAVADTVGAGDAFTGAFVAAIIKGATIEAAHRHAVEVSAYVCTQCGAMPPCPWND